MVDPQTVDQTIVVTGDVTLHWNLARVQNSKGSMEGGSSDDYTRACWQRGGAALLADLIEALANSLHLSEEARIALLQTDAPRRAASPADDHYHHSYALWSPFRSGGKQVWRVQELLGSDPRPAHGALEPLEWEQVVGDSPEANLVVLDDAALGFRDCPELWPLAITAEEQQAWILLRTARPVAQGQLWEQVQNRADRLVVITTIDDLRRTQVQVSRELSWERTAQDLFWELLYNPRVNALSHCAHVVISFGPAGAVLLSREPVEDNGARKGRRSTEQVARRCYLFFDPQVIEGMWEQEHPGGMIGHNACLTAAIARQLMLSPEQPNIHQGIQSGLAAMRTLHQEGYGQRGEAARQVDLAFPIDRIAADLAKVTTPFAVVEVEDPARFLSPFQDRDAEASESGFWTILEDRYAENLTWVAEQIVQHGPEAALRGVPLGRFGHLVTVDRREIESFRSIRALVGEYCRTVRQKRPLSIAVFGAPGSGKSFGLIQVASSLLPGQIEVLEFNLSQFGSTGDLLDALHQVRDVGLSGKIPLVFWDEFDTQFEDQPLGWLRYFLAPMQDGRFQQGQISHPIGRAIFVFAGGTSARMEDFGQALGAEQFRTVKGPDFVSRLKGYVNILGPNQQQGVSSGDPHYIIRRAIVLRSLLQRNAPQLFQQKDGKEIPSIDPGVLRAFLQTRVYRHGIRSMEAILAMSLLAGKTSYEQSSLPAEAQLNLHVDAQDFLALVQTMELAGALLERLAEAAHGVFCESMRARGYRFGPRTDDEGKTHSALKPYNELLDQEKDQNRGNVRDIPNKLAHAGYVMMPARSDEPPFNFPGDALETLAEMEHERWMEAKVQAGWQYAAETDKIGKLHNCLVSWDQLPEREREKDRVMVRQIPKILAWAGYTVKEAQGAEPLK